MRFTLASLMAILLCNGAKADGISWAGIADTHYGGTPWTWEQGTNAYGAISNEVYFIQTNYLPNFLVHAGDVGESAVTNYTTYLTNMLVWSSNRYEIAGNHDVASGNWTPWTNLFSRRVAWTNGNYIFIGVGSYWDPATGTNGTIDDQDLDFMQTVMTNAYPTWTNFIVMSHISVVTNNTFGNISSGYGLERLTNLFNYYGVITYIYGHQHSVAATPLVIAGTLTFQSFIPSLTRYQSARGAYQLFTLTNTTLISTTYRTDTHAVVSSTTNTVPRYVDVWPPTGNFYVATNGDDANSGTISSPFRTVQKGVNEAFEGNTVLIGPGDFMEQVLSQRNGTNSYINVDGQNQAGVKNLYLNHSNLFIRNLTVFGRTNANLVYMERGADFCVVSNCIVDGETTNTANLLSWNGPDAAPFGDAGSFNLVISNTFKRALGSLCVGMFGDRNVFFGNRFLDNDSVDIFRTFGRSNYIVGNLVSNVTESGAVGNHPDFLQVFGTSGFGALGTIIESNTVVKMDGESQLCMMSADDVAEIRDFTFQNNLFIGVSAKGTVLCNDVKWYNNLFYHCSTNPATAGNALIYTYLTNATYTNFAVNGGHGGRIYNNIFIGCGDTSTNSGWYSFPTNLTNISSDYNLVSKGYGAVTFDALHRPVGALGGWEPAFWWEDHGINGGDPLFVNESTLNFRLQVGSPLINTGTNLPSVAVDLDGVSRPQGAAWDIGAYEFQSLPGSVPAYIGVGRGVYVTRP